jgi:hypothetical protein
MLVRFLKNLSYITQAFSKTSQAPSLVYLAYSLQHFKVLLTLSQIVKVSTKYLRHTNDLRLPYAKTCAH